ncbi:MAG: hypothetical protein MZV63_15780 [Marinilabiliales bacterium]|nr:hypothetical protein [Marinilabiliales bacterium]
MAVSASEILFGKGTAEELEKLRRKNISWQFLKEFRNLQFRKTEIENGINVVELLAEKTGVFESKGELRRTIQGNGLSINKEKVTECRFSNR